MNKLYDITRKKFKLPTLGFTLVELLAVLVILGLILAIAVPRIVDVIDNTKESAYQINEGMMVSAARNYLVMNDSKNPSEKGTMSIITLEELQNSELISSIHDARDSNIECGGYVVVKNVDDKTFDYRPYLKCENNYQTEGYKEEEVSVIDVLIVAGGGGGAGNCTTCGAAGAGGAGGLIYKENYTLLYGQQIDIIVGKGGLGGIGGTNGSAANGENGEDSVFENFTAIGGGGGRPQSGNAGATGGSGGGGSAGNNPVAGSGGMAIEGQGNIGGAGASCGVCGGGAT